MPEQRRHKLPEFLSLALVSPKPRSARLTHVLDKGISPDDLRVLLARFAAHVDIWKLGWGTAYLDPDLPEKLGILNANGVRACLGGTLLEAAWVQGRAADCLAWCSAAGFPLVEVSNGATDMPLADKRHLITTASRSFTVLAETGSKHPAAMLSPDAWADEMAGDLEAGATWVITEGREHGDVGLFTSDGRVREPEAERLATLVAEKVGLPRVVFEAPQKDQQAWLITRLGADVSLGNVPPGDVLALEALRRGLRGDTIHLLTRCQPRAADSEGACG